MLLRLVSSMRAWRWRVKGTTPSCNKGLLINTAMLAALYVLCLTQSRPACFIATFSIIRSRYPCMKTGQMRNE